MIRLCLLFLLSGSAALMLETVFLRQLAWLFGNSTSATVAVLSAFMAGMALGAAFFGRFVDRRGAPLLVYAWLEFGAALSGGGLAWLLGSGRRIFLAPLRGLDPGPLSNTVEILMAFVLLLVPTVLMGGTLPALGRLVIRDMSRFTGTLGLLYAVNTLGASAGVFLSGFYLFEMLGVSRTAYLAITLQIVAGLGALWLARSRRWSSASAPPPRATTAAPGDGLPRSVRGACLTAAAAAGFAVLGYEVLWARLFSLFMRSFSYSFSLMLSLFLAGLVIGSAALTLLAGRIRNPVRLLAWLQIASAVYVASMPLWLANWLAPIQASSFTEFLIRGALRTALIVLPPTVASGMSLPLAARCVSRGTGRVGSDVGVVYGVNTLGAIVGAAVAGLLLLPALGAPSSLVILALLQSVGGLGVLLAASPGPWRVVAALLLTVSCALPLTFDRQQFVDAFLSASRSSDKIGELLFFREGASDTVAVVRRDYGFHDPRAKSLITNGVAMSATVKPVWRYMAAEGHLPVLLARRPERALLVGVGTGITLGAVASHPQLETIDVVELSRGVIEGLPFFEEENGGAFRDPRVRLIHEDGRHFLEMTSGEYDLITLEPPPPIVAGSVHLYSLDFYRICLERLRPGGVVAQWLPLHAQSSESARMTASTFLEAFPAVTLWLPSIRDAVLIGSREPPILDLQRLERAYADPRTRTNLEQAYLETPESLLATYLLDREGVTAWADAAPPITDERPLMEFFRHQGRTMGDAEIAPLLVPAQADAAQVVGTDVRPELLDDVRRENAALRSYVRSGVEKNAALAADATRLSRGTEFYLYRFGCARRQLRDLQSASSGLSPGSLRRHLQRCAALGARAAGDVDTRGATGEVR